MLTYNEQILQSAIETAQRNGNLVAADPSAPWEGRPRMFLMCKQLVSEIEEGKRDSDEKVRNRWASLVADIGHFVEGGYINDDLIKQLKPEKYEHWELRSRKPRPSLRVFGRFALPNVFVGTHIQPRKLLGGMWSEEFERAKLVSEQIWKNAGLPENNCFTAPPDFKFEEYITEDASRKVMLPK